MYVSRKILGSGINLSYFDCLIKFIFEFVGKSVPFNESVRVFSIFGKAHQRSTKLTQARFAWDGTVAYH